MTHAHDESENELAGTHPESQMLNESGLRAATAAVTAEIDRYWKDDSVPAGHEPVAEAAIRAYLSASQEAAAPSEELFYRPLEWAALTAALEQIAYMRPSRVKPSKMIEQMERIAIDAIAKVKP